MHPQRRFQQATRGLMHSATTVFAACLALCGLPAGAQLDKTRAAEKAAVPTTTHPYADIWKASCSDGFGLAIAPADGSLYSVSFCGPGGCFAPGTYRPNTKLVGDPDYRLIDSNTVEVRTAQGFSKYVRCSGTRAESTKSGDGITATIMLTKKPEEFVRKWVDSKGQGKLSVETSKTVRFGEYIAALVFFRGCRSGVNCRVYVDYELAAPDGSIRYRVPDKAGTTQPNPRPELHYLSEAIVRFDFKPGDLLGQYTINATVREPAKGTVVRVTDRFEVIK